MQAEESTPPGRVAAGREPAGREANMGEPAIEVHGLRKSFGEKDAVAGIDLVGPRAGGEEGLSWLGSSSN